MTYEENVWYDDPNNKANALQWRRVGKFIELRFDLNISVPIEVTSDTQRKMDELLALRPPQTP